MVINLPIFIFVLLFMSPETPAAVDPKYEACRRRVTCRGNQTIQYPFIIENRQPEYCGYPGFKLKCSNPAGRPVLHLSGMDLLVHSISYEEQRVRVSDDAVRTASGCGVLIGNLSRSNEPFRLVEGRSPAEICGGAESRAAAARNGLVMEWTAGACRNCSRSNGFCGFEIETRYFKCYCPDRPHALRCSSPG